MASNEIGWGKPTTDGVYWWRLNVDDTPDPVTVRGDFAYDTGYPEPTSTSLGEFLGPISPSDAEQLIQLRKALNESVVGEDNLQDILARTFHSPQFSADVYAYDVRHLVQTVLTLRQAAQTALHCLEKSRKGFTAWPEADAAIDKLRAALNPDLQKETQ